MLKCETSLDLGKVACRRYWEGRILLSDSADDLLSILAQITICLKTHDLIPSQYFYLADLIGKRLNRD